MKISTTAITVAIFIVVCVAYFAWVGKQLATRPFFPGIFWPF